MKVGQEIPTSSDTSGLLATYEAGLLERVANESRQVDRLLSDPPQAILIHVYACEKDQSGKYVPNVEGHYGIRAALEFVQAARERNADYSPIILTAAGLSYRYEGNNISRIYKDTIVGEMESMGLSGVIVTDEQEFAQTQDVLRLASDTRGELRFLKEFAKQGYITNALSIGRIEHQERIKRLLEANRIEAENLSTEGILAYFHPESIDRFIQLFGDIIESDYGFSEAEKKKLLIMFIDKRGAVLEFIAKVAGPLKDRLLQALGHEKL